MTISFDTKRSQWRPQVSYDTSCFSRVGDRLISYQSDMTVTDDEDNLVPITLAWRHNVGANNTFYEVTTPSSLSVTFNDKVSGNKIFKTISAEGSGLDGVSCYMIANDSTDGEQFRDVASETILSERGGIFYGQVGRDRRTSPGDNLKCLGRILLGSETVSDYGELRIPLDPLPAFRNLSTSTYINGYVSAKYLIGTDSDVGMDIRAPSSPIQISISSHLLYYDAIPPSIVPSFGTDAVSKEKDSIIVTVTEAYSGGSALLEGLGDNANATDLAGALNTETEGEDLYLFVLTDNRINGEEIRGQYLGMQVELGSNDFELHALNMDYELTSLDHNNV
jgi:hypothetical protein